MLPTVLSKSNPSPKAQPPTSFQRNLLPILIESYPYVKNIYMSTNHIPKQTLQQTRIELNFFRLVG